MIGSSVNLVSVLVAAVVAMFLGSLWYAPFVFGKKWAVLAGIKKMDSSPKIYVLGFLSALITSYILGMFIGYFELSVLSSVYVGFLLWLGFIATTSLGRVLWEDSSVELYVLNNSYYLLQMIVMSIILSLWI